MFLEKDASDDIYRYRLTSIFILAAILVTFDLNDKESLMHARQWMEEACENIQMDTPLRFLIGAKTDLLVCTFFCFAQFI